MRPPGPNVDFGRHSSDYGAFRPGLPATFYDRLSRIVRYEGADALDLGTGPGTVALELAARGARVTGIDVADGQVDEARRRAEAAGLAPRCTFKVAAAERTGLPADAFDLVIAAQCWWWLDREQALAEVTRLLRSGGRLVVCAFNYMPRQSEVARKTEALILKHNPGWGMADHPGILPHWIEELQTDELRLVEQFCYDHRQPFTHEGWRGRIRTCHGVGSGGMDVATVERFDAELARMLEADHPEPLQVEHRVWCVVVRKGAGAD